MRRIPAFRPNRPLAKRKDAVKRGYNKTWERLRAWYLAGNPLCDICNAEGRITIANEVHHKIKIKDRPDLRLDTDNLQALCKPCHSRHHANERKNDSK